MVEYQMGVGRKPLLRMLWPLGARCLLGMMGEVHGQGLDSADLELRLDARLGHFYFVLLPFGSHLVLKNSMIRYFF